MAPYVPPQRRGEPASAAVEKPPSRNQDSRFKDDRDDVRAAPAPRDNNRSSGGYGGDDVRYAAGDIRGEKQVDRGGGGGGWYNRQDGRRTGFGEPSELEVFGEKKERGGGIDFDQYDKIPVEVTGEGGDQYPPIKTFAEFKLSEQLSWNLNRCGYDRPTPIQKYAVPIVVGGRDLMACAQTGSGKTCAFSVPCIESLLRSGPPASQNSRGRPVPQPCALVLAPTRELAMQIHEEILKFAYKTGVNSKIIYGGADIRDQLRELGKGTDILVATPGRLSDFISRESVDMGWTQFLILDEADRMLDMGFEPQVREIVQRSGLSRYRKNESRQNMMFSATFAGAVQKMAGDFMVDYLFITVGRVGSCSETITQTLHYAADGQGKTRALEKIYRENAPPDGFLTVIFVDTKRKADEIESDLWNSGLRVCAIHGDRDQQQREQALEAFKSGENPILVATDVAARGLDISNVGLVINFDMPKHMDDYVHRIGRTGRAGKRGAAIGFVNEKCRYCTELAELLRGANQEVPSWLSQLATENLDNYKASKGKGKGAGPNFGGKDIRETSKAAKAAEEEQKKKDEEKKAAEEAAAKKKKENERPPSPERVIPDGWDDSDDDA